MSEINSVGAVQGSYRSQAAQSTGTVQGGGFAALLMQLLGSEDGEQMLLDFLAAQRDEDENTNAMMLIAELLAGQTGLSLPEFMAAAQGELAGAEQYFGGTVSELREQTLEEALYSVERRTVTEGEGEFSSVFEDMRALAAERVQKPQKSQQAELDIEKLQADVDAKKFMPLSAERTIEGFIAKSGMELTEQVKTGILENLAKNRDEFVIKLRPEGLGEITVKMQQQDGKVLLSISTSSAELAKSLGQEVAALQNALRPLQAEVQEITVYQQAGYAAQQQAFGGQRERHTESRPQSRRGHTGTAAIDAVPEPGETEQLTADGLDSYI